MKKSLLLVLPLLFPVLSLAQTPVFRCEVDGRVVWSDNPCKSKGKVVTVKPLKTQPAKNDNAPKSQPK
ncbi:DUF4124 domain-containing protein [Undibacterium sp. TC9W]|uniref:DUF4124 domain-containing protein n=1 Tax=Undibacterium sp. TC9W TaxID=3413053 RepID=UPI003BF0D692